ncbi:MAG: T9SS type A sorting domain-containing protein [Candidatus Cloacimonetes bacterium]|nr:T9SS type A sorting domain-containing protein [Candidatus Cloacimonadota bacterium]
MKKTIALILGIIFLFSSIYAQNYQEMHIAQPYPWQHTEGARDIYGFNIAFLPYYFGFFMMMAYFTAVGMDTYGWVTRDWETISEWEFTYDGENIVEASWTLDYFTQYYINDYQDGKLVSTLVQNDLLGYMMDVELYEYYYSGDMLTGWQSQMTDYMGGWLYDEKGTYTYTGDNMTEYLVQNWNDLSQSWENDEYYTCTYSGDHLIEHILQLWSGSWYYYEKSEYIYVGDHNTEILSYEWDGANWEYYFHETMYYDNDFVVNILIEEWTGGNWVNFEYITNTPYGDYAIDESIIQEWDGIQWKNIMKLDYLYDTANDDNQLPLTDLQLRNFPNPFNPSTNIQWQQPLVGSARIEIFNLKGELINTFSGNEFPCGENSITWDGKDMQHNQQPSGTYLYRISMGDVTQTKKMVMLK